MILYFIIYLPAVEIMEKYEKLKKIGSGSYGYVYKCRNRENGNIVAIKKFLETEEDPTIQKITFREIRVLRDLHHPNIVNLVEVFRRKRKLHLVFEFCSSNLLDLMTGHPSGIPALVARDILYQILQALHYMHANLYVHRDIKPENILLHGNLVKVCDFGFARPINKPNPADFEKQSLPAFYTDYVATRWYRAPELLVGEPLYGPAVDIWATGCVFAECMTGKPIWSGTTDLDQLFLIRKTLGEIPQRYLKFFDRNPFFSGASLSSIPQPLETLKTKLTSKTEEMDFEVLKLMLAKDGEKRATAQFLMDQAYFAELPLTVPFNELIQTKPKQMYAVFKIFDQEDVWEVLADKSHGQDFCREQKHELLALGPGSPDLLQSKHSAEISVPPGVSDLLILRKELGCLIPCLMEEFMMRDPASRKNVEELS